MIAQCGCVSTTNVAVPTNLRSSGALYQDSLYGKGMRVHNLVKPKSKGDTPTARCTVCGVVRGVQV